MGFALKASMAAGIVALFVWLTYLGMRTRRSGPYQAVMNALRKKGLMLSPSSSHEDHFREVSMRFPDLRDDYEAFLRDYLAWRFGGRRMDIMEKAEKIIQAIEKTAAKA